MSDKQRATLLLEAGRKLQAGFDEVLGKIQAMKDQSNDQTLFLKKAYEFARWGYESDKPYEQTYNVETAA